MHILPTGIFQTGGHATHTHDAHGSTYTVLSLERNNTGTQVCAKSTCSCAPNWQASMLCGCHGSPSFRHTAFSAVNACCLHVLILWRALVFDISRKRLRCAKAVARCPPRSESQTASCGGEDYRKMPSDLRSRLQHYN